MKANKRSLAYWIAAFLKIPRSDRSEDDGDKLERLFETSHSVPRIYIDWRSRGGNQYRVAGELRVCDDDLVQFDMIVGWNHEGPEFQFRMLGGQVSPTLEKQLAKEMQEMLLMLYTWEETHETR